MTLIRSAAGLLFFALSVLITSSLTSGCDECVGIICGPLHVENGTYPFVGDSPPVWALEIGEVVITETTLTVNYTGFDQEPGQAVWLVTIP
jgi:hypothetical protein